MQETICDALGKSIEVGSRIVYAVRDGSCVAALRTATVLGIEAADLKRGRTYSIKVVTPSNKQLCLRYPDRIAVVA